MLNVMSEGGDFQSLVRVRLDLEKPLERIFRMDRIFGTLDCAMIVSIDFLRRLMLFIAVTNHHSADGFGVHQDRKDN